MGIFHSFLAMFRLHFSLRSKPQPVSGVKKKVQVELQQARPAGDPEHHESRHVIPVSGSLTMEPNKNIGKPLDLWLHHYRLRGLGASRVAWARFCPKRRAIHTQQIVNPAEV